MSSTPFFSKNNIKLLYEIIQDYIHRTLVFRIGGEYVNELTNIMKYIYQQNGSPKKQSPQTIQTLNKATLDEALPLFEKLIRDSLENTSREQYPNPSNNGPHMTPRPKTSMPSNIEMDEYIDGAMSTSLEDLQQQDNNFAISSRLDNTELMPPGTSFDPYFDDRFDKNNVEDDDKEVPGEPIVDNDNDNDDDEDNTDDEKTEDKEDIIIPINGSHMSTNITDLQRDDDDNNDDDENVINLKDLNLPSDPPPRELVKQAVLVDSRARNLSADRNSNRYRVSLQQSFFDVVSVELVTAEIPRSEYIVTQRNNLLHFQEAEDDICIAEIEEGNYTPELLRERLEQAMIEASQHDIIYRIRLDKLKNKYSIMSPALYPLQFNLLIAEEESNEMEYRPRSIGRLLGFDPCNLYGENEYVAEKSYDFSPDKYVLLHCEELMMINNRVNRDFLAKIVLDVPFGETKYFMRSNLNRFLCEFDPPLESLDSLSLSFRTFDGELYDFRGCENSLTLEITTVKPKPQNIMMESYVESYVESYEEPYEEPYDDDIDDDIDDNKEKFETQENKDINDINEEDLT